MSKPRKPQSLTTGREAAMRAVIRKSSTGYAVIVDMTDREPLEVVQAKDRTAAIAEALKIFDRDLTFSGFILTAQGKAK